MLGRCSGYSAIIQAVLDCVEKVLFATILGQKTACTDLVCPF